MSVPTHTKALDLAYIALMAALIALCAWISVPLGPVPFTMQTFGIFAALGLVLCYAFGTFWFLTVYTGGSGETLLGALTLCVFPYVLPDLGKIFLALVLVSRVKKHLAL